MSEETRSAVVERELELEVSPEILRANTEAWWTQVFTAHPEKRAELKKLARRAKTRKKFISRQIAAMKLSGSDDVVPTGAREVSHRCLLRHA